MLKRGCLSTGSGLPGWGKHSNIRWSREAAIPRFRGTRQTRKRLGPSLPESFLTVSSNPEDSGGTRRGLRKDSGGTRDSVRLGKRLGARLEMELGEGSDFALWIIRRLRELLGLHLPICARFEHEPAVILDLCTKTCLSGSHFLMPYGLGGPINSENRCPGGDCLSVRSTRPGRRRRLGARWNREAAIPRLRNPSRVRHGLRRAVFLRSYGFRESVSHPSLARLQSVKPRLASVSLRNPSPSSSQTPSKARLFSCELFV